MIRETLALVCLGVAFACFMMIVTNLIFGDAREAVMYLLVLLLFCFASWGFLPRKNQPAQ